MNEIYLLYVPDLNAYKVGVSKNTKTRIKQLQTGCPYLIEVKSIFKSEFAYKLEKALHNEFSSYKIDVNEIYLKGEWFSLNQDQINNFINKCNIYEENFSFLKDSGNHHFEKLL